MVSLTSMQTECPHCHTFFHVTDEQLQAAEGQVRCGKCNTVFTAEVIAEAENIDALENVDTPTLVIDDISVAELDEVEIEVGELEIPDSITAPELEPAELDDGELEAIDYSSIESSEQETEPKSESESESE
ncbi:MAG: zinc-ribbon domain-containing protein, partial [Sulfuriflexus sp.]|nr:zinc-ribbon domain-containing protein [Sulfuriflexus sp.]